MKVFVSVVLAWFVLHWAFVATMAAKNAEGLTRYWRAILLPLAVVGVVLDIGFNLTAGSVLFRELPKELLFTSRCQRHYDTGSGSRYRMAVWWKKQLNIFDPNHIRDRE